MRLPKVGTGPKSAASENTLPYLALILALSIWLGLLVGERIWG